MYVYVCDTGTQRESIGGCTVYRERGVGLSERQSEGREMDGAVERVQGADS